MASPVAVAAQPPTPTERPQTPAEIEREKRQWRAWLEADYLAYREEVDTRGTWRVEWGRARVMPPEFLALLKQAAKAYPKLEERRQVRAVDPKKATERPWERLFDTVQLTAHADNWLSLAVPVLTGSYQGVTLASIPRRIRARVDEPFQVIVSLSALVETVALMRKKERIDLAYHWLTHALHITQPSDVGQTRLWTWEKPRRGERLGVWPPVGRVVA